jgi:hypothetical protein
MTAHSILELVRVAHGAEPATSLYNPWDRL